MMAHDSWPLVAYVDEVLRELNLEVMQRFPYPKSEYYWQLKLPGIDDASVWLRIDAARLEHANHIAATRRELAGALRVSVGSLSKPILPDGTRSVIVTIGKDDYEFLKRDFSPSDRPISGL
jgi:hypothetical protein